jgi:hypothetical protein
LLRKLRLSPFQKVVSLVAPVTPKVAKAVGVRSVETVARVPQPVPVLLPAPVLVQLLLVLPRRGKAEQLPTRPAVLLVPLRRLQHPTPLRRMVRQLMPLLLLLAEETLKHL